MPTSTVQLNDAASFVDLAPGGYQLRAPGLRGTVKDLAAGAPETRAAEGVHAERLRLAVAGADVLLVKVFELDVSRTAPVAGRADTSATPGAARTRSGEPAMTLRVPRLRPDTDYAVLYTDESGYSRWILPNPGADAAAAVASSGAASVSTTAAPGESARTRGGAGATLSFNLPRDAAPLPPTDPGKAPGTRGPISTIGRRVVRVLLWVTDDIVGRFSVKAAQKWEEQQRPYGLHPVGAAGIDPAVPLGPADWRRMAAGPALLLLHGTFSSAQAGFGDLVGDASFVDLAGHYGGRVFAFNHPSMHHSPAQNVQTLLAQLKQHLPTAARPTFDLVTHSRGGLLARELSERRAELDPGGVGLTVRRAVLVAGPNRGTILADGDNWIALADRYTNFITKLPDNAYTLTMEGILTFVKVMAHGALAGLPGLACLNPGGGDLKRLNAAAQPPTTYHSIGASFTPSDPGMIAQLCKRVGDTLVDRIFGEDNDGVVPAEGTFSTGGAASPFKPLPEHRRIYVLDDRMHHCNYFEHDVVRRQIRDWLTA
jgi:hypothetical protein